MTIAEGADGPDAYSWWIALIRRELEDCARLERVDSGLALDVTTVTITPFREGALPLRIVTGAAAVPEIEFGSSGPIPCVGVSAADGSSLDPSNHLGVMVAAVVTDGAVLLAGRLGRRTLALGHGDRFPEVEGRAVLHRWAPYADGYVPTTVFRRPPDYESLPRDAFLVKGVSSRMAPR